MFREAGDEDGARILERVEREEIGHVAFAVHWFEALTGSALDYDAWCATLPEPVTPSILRGRPLNREARLRAGFPEELLERLAEAPSSTRPRTPVGSSARAGKSS